MKNYSIREIRSLKNELYLPIRINQLKTPPQLPTDILHEIFKYLTHSIALNSTLLVCHHWSEVCVPFLWRNIRNYKTLISCLPNESKELLRRNDIIIPTSTPFFNYTQFIKFLSIEKTSLIGLGFESNHFQDVTYSTYPGTVRCLKDLSELTCTSDVFSEFFYHIFKICKNLRLIKLVIVECNITRSLSDLFSAMKDLKHIKIVPNCGWDDFTEYLCELPNSLIKLEIYAQENFMSLSKVERLKNLEEITLCFNDVDSFEGFETCHFPRLKIFELQKASPDGERLTEFLEINGNQLEELYLGSSDSLTNLAIFKNCPNLKSLYTPFLNEEDETLKMILLNCQKLEHVRFCCGTDYLSESTILDLVVTHAPENFYGISLYYPKGQDTGLLSYDLNNFFINWAIRKPLKLIVFSLVNARRALANPKIIDVFEKDEFDVIKRLQIF
ncbi:14153_t:CDS:2 [Funneliformis geosporum]|uniref:14153_t:CDS:1 n=1 Tax=Funneliformis geosporum TaxID=1117311 RepID=A0A9W4SX21_9GLOM|nr:14153_t:CDS:2 [Funneliformis geosporum]